VEAVSCLDPETIKFIAVMAMLATVGVAGCAAMAIVAWKMH
jgi:hypothetical protein